MEILDCEDTIQLTEKGLLEILRHCGGNLKSLSFQGTNVTCESLSYLESLPFIGILNCDDSSLTDSGLLQLLRLCGNTLNFIDLSGTTITGVGISEYLISLPCLEHLICQRCNNLTNDGVLDLLQVCGNTIKTLAVGGTLITEQIFEKIELIHIFVCGKPLTVRFYLKLNFSRYIAPIFLLTILAFSYFLFIKYKQINTQTNIQY